MSMDDINIIADLTEKEQDVLYFIRKSLSDGIAPSVREICKATGIKSTSTVHGCLKSLDNKGVITRKDGLNRHIKLTEEYSEYLSAIKVPLLGRVTAGIPILANEEVEDFIPYMSQNLSSEDLFALRIVGDSMVNAGILDGDTIIIEKTNVARNGEIVVALIEDEATVKRFYQENNYIRLQPENDAYEPIIVDECMVLGKVISLVRDYIH